MVQTNCVKPKVLFIGGPTAIGKSSFAIECALKYDGEIVSADSMQIYEGMNVGTGKVTADEMRGIAHHMLDIVKPDEPYSVGSFVKDAESVIYDILSRKKLPIVVGGTGLYLNALINGMNFSDADKSEEVREKWKKIASVNGNQFIYDRLKQIDPISAEKISVNDVKRIIRAIEIFEVTGRAKSASATTQESKYDYLFIILNAEREKLYELINTRVDKMFYDDGFFEEALTLRKFSECQSMQALGYKQIYEFLDGKYEDVHDVIEDVKKLTRNYAKRQLTFFRGMKANKEWIMPDEKDRAYDIIGRFLEK